MVVELVFGTFEHMLGEAMKTLLSGEDCMVVFFVFVHRIAMFEDKSGFFAVVLRVTVLMFLMSLFLSLLMSKVIFKELIMGKDTWCIGWPEVLEHCLAFLLNLIL